MSGLTTSTINSVEKHGCGYFITKSDGWGFCLSECSVEPKVGDEITVRESGTFEVLDVYLNGTMVFHQTEEELARKKEQHLEELRANRKADYEKNKALWESQIEALSPPFRERMRRFISRNGGAERFFTKDMGSYELFICMEAEKAIGVLQPMVWQWENHQRACWDVLTDSGKTKRLEAVLSKEHSGYTWESSVQLALAVIYGLAV